MLYYRHLHFLAVKSLYEAFCMLLDAFKVSEDQRDNVVTLAHFHVRSLIRDSYKEGLLYSSQNLHEVIWPKEKDERDFETASMMFAKVKAEYESVSADYNEMRRAHAQRLVDYAPTFEQYKMIGRLLEGTEEMREFFELLNDVSQLKRTLNIFIALTIRSYRTRR